MTKEIRHEMIAFGCLGHTGIYHDKRLYIDAEKAEEIFNKLVDEIERLEEEVGKQHG